MEQVLEVKSTRNESFVVKIILAFKLKLRITWLYPDSFEISIKSIRSDMFQPNENFF